MEHVIPKRMLRGTHESTDRLSATINRLMKTLVEVRVMRDGKSSRLKFQLLGPTVENRNDDGNLYYRFLPELIEVIAMSDHWARLNVETMLSMQSKYSLALYEMVEKRAGLNSRFKERFTLEEFRAFLGVPVGKLERWPDLKRKCIEPAVREVAAKSSCHVRIDPVKARPVQHVDLAWFPKDVEGRKSAYAEIQRYKTDRKARPSAAKIITSPASETDDNLTN
jgi:plasmid replication initiation protein